MKKVLLSGGPIWLSCVACASLLAVTAANVVAQSPPPGNQSPQQPAPPANQSPQQPAPPVPEEQTSTEEGQTPLGEGFVTEDDRRQRLRAQRRQNFKDTIFDVQFRTFMLDRDKYDTSQSYALAMGGSAGFKTGYFRDRLAFAATEYTSQPVDAPLDKDGTLLLKKGQESYTVLGEAYAELRLADGVNFNVGRKAYNTPFANRMDIRMTPITFSAVTIQGVRGGGDRGEWRFGVGYFDQIKERNADTFVSMATDAGAPAGVERGAYSGGANYTAKNGAWSFGAVDYYSPDIFNIFYTEARYRLMLGSKRRLLLATQYTAQQSVGGDLLFGKAFSTGQYGAKADFPVGPVLLTAAYTSMSNGFELQNPWAAYPSYTTAQVEEFRRAGEDALKLRASLKVPRVQGLVVVGQWVNGTDPVSATEYAKDEYNFDVKWTPTTGRFKDLVLHMRYAHDVQANDTDQDDLRLILYWTPKLPRLPGHTP